MVNNKGEDYSSEEYRRRRHKNNTAMPSSINGSLMANTLPYQSTMQTQRLGSKQEGVLNCFIKYREKTGVRPTFAVASKILKSTPGNVYFHYKKLKSLGYFDRPQKPTTIVKVGDRFFYLGDEVTMMQASLLSEHELESDK